MKFFAMLSAVFLFFFLAVSASAFAQEPSDRQVQTQDEKAKSKDDKAVKPDDRGVKQDEGKQDERKQDEARPDEKKSTPAHSGTAQQEETRPDRRQQDNTERGHEGRPVSAQQGQRIPDDKFRAHFGREHHFHVDRARVVNQSQPVVVYGGYSFELVDPWPAEWSYDDDCYIDYVDDNYYLFDVAHPGIRIAVLVLG